MDAQSLLDAAEHALYWIAATVAAVNATLAIRRARSGQAAWLFQLLAGAFGCIFLSDLVWIVAWLADGYPYFFSPADLSHIGALFFFITIELQLVGPSFGPIRGGPRRYRVFALGAPGVVIGLHLAQYAIYPDIWFNIAAYCLPLALLAYLAAWLWLATQGSHGPGRPRAPGRGFQAAILAFVLIESVMFTLSTVGQPLAVATLIADYLVVAALAAIYPTAVRLAELGLAAAAAAAQLAPPGAAPLGPPDAAPTRPADVPPEANNQ